MFGTGESDAEEAGCLPFVLQLVGSFITYGSRYRLAADLTP